MKKSDKNSIENSKKDERSEREAILDSAMQSIRKECNIQIRDLSKTGIEKVEVISTGVLSIDRALRAFGFPRGKIIELFGPQASGKSALALMAAAEVQKNNGVVALFDLENSLDVSFANLLGVNVDNLLYVDDAPAESAIDAMITLCETKKVDLIIVDSVSALVPREELNNDMNNNQVALQARILSKGLRKLTAVVGRTNTCIIFINQIRMKIGVMFGNPETTSGGKALPFYASVRCRVFAGADSKIKRGDTIIGHMAKVDVVKNRVGPPFGIGYFTILYDGGIDKVTDICTVAKEEGIINAAGAWMSYTSAKYKNADGEFLFKAQGIESFINGMRGRPDVLAEMRELVIKKVITDAETRRKNSTTDVVNTIFTQQDIQDDI